MLYKCVFPGEFLGVVYDVGDVLETEAGEKKPNEHSFKAFDEKKDRKPDAKEIGKHKMTREQLELALENAGISFSKSCSIAELDKKFSEQFDQGNA